MNIFISGGCKNGKSTTACRLAMQLARGAPLYYVATMIPRDAEDRERIAYHVRRREGLGFQTVEQGRRIDQCRLPKCGATVLLDSVTALMQNETFGDDGSFTPCPAQVAEQLLEFARDAANVIFISDYLYSDAGCYDQLTKDYCRALAQVDRTLAEACDAVVEICAATMTVHKGTLPLFWEPLPGHSARELILGGAGQGKLAYAAARYGVNAGDFYRCSPDMAPDLTAPYIYGLENYVLYCLRHDLQPQIDFRPDAVLVCRDLFCGVVPVEPVQRHWRDATGHYLSRLSAKSARVTRLFGGLPQRIK